MTVVVPSHDFVPGRPNVYGIYYPMINAWYVGKNETGTSDYMGSPGAGARNAIADAHASAGLGVENMVCEKHIDHFWPAARATQAHAGCRRKARPTSNARISAWIATHLRVASVPIADRDRDTLADLEKEVLTHINPPLNLAHCPPSEARARISHRRRALGR